LSAPQNISWSEVGFHTLTPRAAITRKTRQLIPTSAYVAGAYDHDGLGR
jgi:hypothetical protein